MAEGKYLATEARRRFFMKEDNYFFGLSGRLVVKPSEKNRK